MKILVNLSNHPSSKWSDKQKAGWGLNSTMVRLKQERSGKMKDHHLDCLNSTMVRLKL